MVSVYDSNVLARQPNIGTVSRVTFPVKFVPMILALIHIGKVDNHVQADLAVADQDSHLRVDVANDEGTIVAVINGLAIDALLFNETVNEMDLIHNDRPQNKEAGEYCFVSNNNMITVATAKRF